jgi:hypothetical protein
LADTFTVSHASPSKPAKTPMSSIKFSIQRFFGRQI